MTSQLAKQLQQLQTRPDGDQHLAKSFLFSNSDAKQISREQVHELATSGLRTLLAIDNRFAPFLEPVFGQHTIRRERSMFTNEQNTDMSAKIRHICALLSPHLFIMAAQQVFEYLVRIYEVHTYDVRTVLQMFLPFHDHAIFGRVVMLLDLRSTGFDFLAKNQESGTILPRASLVTAAAENGKVMRLLCDIASDAVRYEVVNNAAFALLAGVATAAAARPENDAVLRILLPFLVEFLEEPHTVASPTALLIVCVWSQEGSMTPKALAAIVRPIIASLGWSQYPVTLAERLAALGHVFKFQGGATHDVAFSPILEALTALPSWRDWWASGAISQAATAALTHRLLDFSLLQLRDFKPVIGTTSAITAGSNCVQFLCAACEHMGHLGKKEISAVFGCFVRFLSASEASVAIGTAKVTPAMRAVVEEVADLLSSSLRALERRFPLVMDEVVSDALAAAINGGGGAKAAPTYEEMIRFVSSHFSGTKYEMIEVPASLVSFSPAAFSSAAPHAAGSSDSEESGADDAEAAAPTAAAPAVRKVPLLTCLLHQVPEVRRLAFFALSYRVKTQQSSSSSSTAEANPAVGPIKVTLVEEMFASAATVASASVSAAAAAENAKNAAKSNLLPLIRHAIECETSPTVATEALAFARSLILAAVEKRTRVVEKISCIEERKKAQKGDNAIVVAINAAVGGLVGALWTMLSSSLGSVMDFGGKKNNAAADNDDGDDDNTTAAENTNASAASSSSSAAVAAFVALLAEVIAAEAKACGFTTTATTAAAASPADANKKLNKGAKGITAATDATSGTTTAAASAAAPTPIIPYKRIAAASPLLAKVLYYFTVAACTEAGANGTTAVLEALFASLGLPAPAEGFAVAGPTTAAVAAEGKEDEHESANNKEQSEQKKRRTIADTDSDSDEEERRPKKKVGEAPSSSTAGSNKNTNKKGGAAAAAASAAAVVPLALSHCPAALFGPTSAAGKLIFAVISAHVPAADIAAVSEQWARRRALLTASKGSDAAYALHQTEGLDAIQLNMLNAHVSEAAVLAAVASAAASSAAPAAYGSLLKVLEVTAVPTTAVPKRTNAVPTTAVAMGLRAGLTAGLTLLASPATNNAAAAAAVAAFSPEVVAKLIAILVTRFSQALPPIALIPAAALWALSALSTTSSSSGGVIRVSVEMGSASSLYGLVGPAGPSTATLSKDESRMQDERSAQLFAAVAEAVFTSSANINNNNNNNGPLSHDAIAFALLLPTMAPSRDLRQFAVEQLQTAVLGGIATAAASPSKKEKGAAGGGGGASASFIAGAVRQLTTTASLSVTAVNSLVEVLAQPDAAKVTTCLTEDMAKAVLQLLLGTSSSSSSVALSPSYIANALSALFGHNKRSIQKHGELVLAALLPSFIRSTFAKAATTPLTVGEAELLFTAAKFINFAGVTSFSAASAPLEATCEMAALCIQRGGVRIAVGDGSTKNLLLTNNNKTVKDDIQIRSVFVPALAALTTISPKLLTFASSHSHSSSDYVSMVLTPARLLLELLVPLYERGGAVSSDAEDTTTAAQHVVAFLTTTTFGFESVLNPALPAMIMGLGSYVGGAAGEEEGEERSVGKKAAASRGADGDDKGKKGANNNASSSSMYNIPQLVDLATEVVAFLGTASNTSTTGNEAGAMMAGGAAESALKQIAASSGIAATRNAVLSAAIVARLFRGAFLALERLPTAAADIASAAGGPNADAAAVSATASMIVAVRVNLLKFIATLVQAAPSADGFVRENPNGKSIDRMIVAVDDEEGANNNNDDDDEAGEGNAGDNNNSNTTNEKESALGYILRTFEMSLLTPFLLGQGCEEEQQSNEQLPQHNIVLGGSNGANSIAATASGSVALTLSSMRAVQMLITTVSANAVALTAGKATKHHTRIVIDAKHRLVRQSLLLISSLFVNEDAANTSSANTLVAVVSQLLHVIGPLLSGAHAGSAAAAAAYSAGSSSKKGGNKTSSSSATDAASSALGTATSLLHIPLIALYLRLDAAAAARQEALVAEGVTTVNASSLLADGGADYYVSANLLETPIAICVKILTSFAIEEQMAALCGIMELVCDPAAHLARIAAAASADNSATHANVVADLCAKLIKAGRIANRQEPILSIIALTIKSDAFLAPFVALQHADVKRRTARKEEIARVDLARRKEERKKVAEATGVSVRKVVDADTEEAERLKDEAAADAVVDVFNSDNSTNVDGATHCANLLVASLNLFAHYHALNAAMLASKKKARAAADDEDADISGAELDDDEDADLRAEEFSEEKAYTTLLELLAGNCLGCILAAINEPTFVDCQRRMLSSDQPALRQKGLETLLDRLHQSLPTAEDDALATSATGTYSRMTKNAKDPRSREHLLDVLQLKARPQTTRVSAVLLPLLLEVLQHALSTEALFATSASTTSGTTTATAAKKADASGGKKAKKNGDSAADTTVAAAAQFTSVEQRINTVQITLACLEELTRIVGAGGSGKADKALSRPQVLGGMASAGSTTITDSALVTYFHSRARLQDVHKAVALTLRHLAEWGAALLVARRGMSPKYLSKDQQVLVSSLVTPTRPQPARKAALQTLLVLAGSCFSLVSTVVRTLTVTFTAPHSNDILKVTSSWMTIVMQLSTAGTGASAAGSAPLTIESLAHDPSSKYTPSVDNIYSATVLRHPAVGSALAHLYAVFRSGGGPSAEATNYLRKALLHSIHFTLPSTWTMAHPYIPTFVSFATHNCNVNDGETAETSANFLSSLRAVLGDRGLLECVCSSLINSNNSNNNNNNGAAAADIVVPVTPATHSIRLIFIFVEKMITEMTKEEISTMPILLTGSGADEDVPGASAAPATAGKNFWLTAFAALAGAGTSVPAPDAMAPVFDAYTAFFIKFKEKTCGQFWTRVTDWAVNRQQQAATAAAAAEKEKRRRTESGALDENNNNNNYSEEGADNGTASTADGGYTRKQVAVHYVYLSLYNHLLRRLRAIMTFSFPIVSNVMVELLQRYNPTPFVNLSSALAASSSSSDKKMAALLGGGASSTDSTGGQWIFKSKASNFIIFATASALLSTVQLMAEAQIPEDATYAARTGVQTEAFFAKVDVFNTFMPLIFSQLANTHVFSYDSSVGTESASLGFFKRAERSIVPALRKYFACLNGPKLWSLAQKELIKYLRHPKSAVRRAALLVMQLCYRDGGDVLCSFIMAEGLPAIVEMTEDNDKEVVEQARLLCNELSTITGQDVLHAMA